MREPALTRKAIEAVWRIEAARLIGGLSCASFVTSIAQKTSRRKRS